MKTTDFDYILPPEKIAQIPIEPRHSSRLMVLDRTSNHLFHTTFWEIGQFLKPGDVLVLNQTRVIPARLYANKIPGGGKIELLLLRRLDELTWDVLGGGKGLIPGRRLQIIGGPPAEIIEALEGSRRVVHFHQPIELFFEEAGHVPLPPYIHTSLTDKERYQTVYAHDPGSAAAPTAGLHFTPELISRLENQGVQFAKLTLHVGLDTFAPVHEEDPVEHKIHTEWCDLPAQTAELINSTRQSGGRVVAVGTTCVRTLETAARYAGEGNRVGVFSGATNLFILPGYQFKAVDALITNFHLPRSTLLMLVSAFAGKERILQAYSAAIEANYRFYSFGDAMLIL